MKAIALILAAGKGTRMKSDLIKVLHPILGRSMVGWSIDIARGAGLQPCIVVGHQEDRVRDALANEDVSFARQSTPQGTGHAVLCALDELPMEGTLLVMFGDTPLFRSETLSHLLSVHQEEGNLATFLTATIDEAGSYGRLIRDADGRPLRIVEASEASAEELLVNEINTGASVFDLAWLRGELPSFEPHAPKNEIYLTDALERAAQRGRAGAVILSDLQEADGVNDRWHLAKAEEVLQQRILKRHSLNGVRFEDLSGTRVDAAVSIERDVTIGRGVELRGGTTIKTGVRVGAYSVVEDCSVERGAQIHPYSHCVSAVIGESSSVGPYGRLRVGAELRSGAKGQFVEVKKSVLDVGAKVNHLTYIGDARIGAGANIGAGTITCIYDGFGKHRTEIGAGAFIGSNSALVAPVQIGDGAIVGAGSTITEAVPANAIAVARGAQRTIEAAAERFRARRQK